MEYPKIHSLWKRKGWYFEQGQKISDDYQKGRQSFIEGDYAREEFGNIKHWSVVEKIDGTNIRISFSQVDEWRAPPTIQGRTSGTIIQSFLLPHLQEIATWDRLDEALIRYSYGPYKPRSFNDLILFGEGYGPKIQKGGGNYRDAVGFILFDAIVDRRWLPHDDVERLATYLEIPSVPLLSTKMDEGEIVAYVKSKPLSKCSLQPQVMEGVIARAEPRLYDSHGIPITFKLKCKEF